MERKGLYNTLQMQLTTSEETGEGVYQNLRTKSVDELFAIAHPFLPTLDKEVFCGYAEVVDTPEELCDCFVADSQFEAKEQDLIYLTLFELWRRLMPHKPSLSIFCDELEHQIHYYDDGAPCHAIEMQDMIAHLQSILEESADEGQDPKAIFQAIESHLANHLESFLYDYISEQLEMGQNDYAQELLDSFEPFVAEEKWFVFLRIELLATLNKALANEKLEALFDQMKSDPEFEFHLEVLEFLSGWGDPKLFLNLAAHTFHLIETERDLQELLALCASYYSRLDCDDKEKTLVTLLKERKCIPQDTVIEKEDVLVTGLVEYLTQ